MTMKLFHRRLEPLSGAELWGNGLGDMDFLAGAGINARAGASFLNEKKAESGYQNLLPLRQGPHDSIKNSIHRILGVLFGPSDFGIDRVHNAVFIHILHYNKHP